MNSFTGPVQNNAKSLEIKFKKAQQMQIVKEKIDELFDEANRKVIRGSDHLKCQYEIYQNDIKSSEEILRYETLKYQDIFTCIFRKEHLKCGECKKYLGGFIITAIFCHCCNMYFHINCFELDKGKEESPRSSIMPKPSFPGIKVQHATYFLGCFQEIKSPAKYILK